MSTIIELPSGIIVRGIFLTERTTLHVTMRHLYNDSFSVTLTEKETLGLIRRAMRFVRAEERRERKVAQLEYERAREETHRARMDAIWNNAE